MSDDPALAALVSGQTPLSEAEQNLALSLAGSDTGFIAADRDGRVTRINAVAERLTGWTSEQALGQLLWDVFVREGRPPEVLARNPVEVAMTTGVGIDISHRITSISRDGSYHAVEVRSMPILAQDGTPRGMTMV